MSNQSVSELIILAVTALLKDQVPSATYERDRQAAIALSEGTVICVQEKESPANLRSAASAITQRDFMFTVTIIGRSAEGISSATVTDAILTQAHAKLMADRTLGGLCSLLIEHGRTWDFELADRTACALDMTYLARYSTAANAL